MATETVKELSPLDEDRRLAMPLMEFCDYIGAGRNSGYTAAATGQIPTFKVGKKLFVPAWWWKRLLTGEEV